MGNYWEPVNSSDAVAATVTMNSVVDADRWETQQPISFRFPSPTANREATEPHAAQRGGEGMSAQPPRGSRFDDEDDIREPDDDRPTGRGGGGGGVPPRPPRGNRQFNYEPEERYWTDYLRIAAPVLGVILLIGLAWFWISRLLGDDGTASDTGNNAAVPSVITEASPTIPIVIGSPIPQGTPGAATTPDTNLAGTETATPGSAATEEIAPGTTVVVVDGPVNVRADATTDAEVVTQADDGTEFSVTGEAVEADGYTWWPVENDDYSGYLASDFLEVAQ
jgi:hypothetical protein